MKKLFLCIVAFWVITTSAPGAFAAADTNAAIKFSCWKCVYNAFGKPYRSEGNKKYYSQQQIKEGARYRCETIMKGSNRDPRSCKFGSCKSGICVVEDEPSEPNEPNPPQNGCHNSSDCFHNEHCVGGSCVPLTDRCATNIDCNVGEQCVNGACT